MIRTTVIFVLILFASCASKHEMCTVLEIELLEDGKIVCMGKSEQDCAQVKKHLNSKRVKMCIVEEGVSFENICRCRIYSQHVDRTQVMDIDTVNCERDGFEHIRQAEVTRENYWLKGKLFFVADSSESGREYHYFNPDKEVSYSRHYDANNVLTNEKGSPYLYAQVNYTDSLLVCDSLKISVFVAMPPQTSHTVYWNAGDGKMISLQKGKQPFINEFEHKFDSAGDKLWMFSIEFYDSLTGKSVTISDEIVVSVR